MYIGLYTCPSVSVLYTRSHGHTGSLVDLYYTGISIYIVHATAVSLNTAYLHTEAVIATAPAVVSSLKSSTYFVSTATAVCC